MKEIICEAFCNAVTIKTVPIGIAVGTPFTRPDGDKVGLYVINSDPTQVYLEDDGETVPYLEAQGVDFSNDARASAFENLLSEYSAHYDTEECVIRSDSFGEVELGPRILKFASLLLRMNDFMLVTRERTEDTFKLDVIKAVQERVGDRAEISFDEALNDELADIAVDIIIRRENRDPLALFLGTSDSRALEATLFWMRTEYQEKADCKVMLMIDQILGHKVKQRTLTRAMNLFTVTAFRDDKVEAINRVEREFFGAIQK